MIERELETQGKKMLINDKYPETFGNVLVSKLVNYRVANLYNYEENMKG